jgi:hypothetical protein
MLGRNVEAEAAVERADPSPNSVEDYPKPLKLKFFCKKILYRIRCIMEK